MYEYTLFACHILDRVTVSHSTSLVKYCTVQHWFLVHKPTADHCVWISSKTGSPEFIILRVKGLTGCSSYGYKCLSGVCERKEVTQWLVHSSLSSVAFTLCFFPVPMATVHIFSFELLLSLRLQNFMFSLPCGC
jgi:hypothetical protein